MKIFKKTGKVVEPVIDGAEKDFAYIGNEYIAFMGGVPDGNEALIEIDYAQSRIVRDDILSAMTSSKKVGSFTRAERAVYDQLKAPTSQELQDHIVSGVRLHVAERILSHASQGTQMNMAAAAAAGILDDDQLAAFREGLQWVAAVRLKGKELIQNGVADYENDEHWPEPSEAATALAALF